MRAILAALAFAGALTPFTPVLASEPVIRVAQMARDVTDSVRQQREAREPYRPQGQRTRCGGKR